jgi:chemotaxis protein MotB
MLRWLLTYADMITLLMAFFIMLYSMSILNLNKFRQVAISIRSGFAGLVEGQGRSILASSGQFSAKPSPIEGDSVGVPWRVIRQVQRYIKEQRLDDVVKLRADDRGLIISLVTDKVVFRKGEVDLSAHAMSVLDKVARPLKDLPNQLIVEGHTCDLPISNDRYPSNVHLSAARASNVAYYLIHTVGIDPRRVAVAGYGEWKPLVPNSSEKNRALNRRVDLVVLKPEIRQIER